jgi:hypothetical protein
MTHSKANPNRFEFEFRLSEDQFCEAHRTYLRHSLLTVKNLFLVTIALLIGLVQSQLFGVAEWVFWVFAGIWIAILGLVLFVYIWMPARVYRSRRGYSEAQKLVVDEEGLDWRAGDQHRLMAWKEIVRASDLHPEYVYFHLRHGFPEILPKEVFESEDELKAFDRFVHARISEKN